jgi:hypothetical protein
MDGEISGDPVGRSLPDPGFAGDEGAADPRLAAALAQYAVDGRRAPVLTALSHARLLVPVVALLGPMEGEVEADADGLARDKSADIAVVLMQGQDGRTALLGFTSTATLQAWRPDARPVPVSTDDAARSAVQERADALVIDVAGPTTYVVETAELQELAAGHRLVETSAGYAWLAAG